MYDNKNKNHNGNRHNGNRNNYNNVSTFERKIVSEPHPVCTICKKEIEFINQALHSRDNNGYVHFDCALKIIRNEYNIPFSNRISYLGKGKFGVIEAQKGQKGKINSFTITQTIEWESDESFKCMQAEIEDLKK